MTNSSNRAKMKLTRRTITDIAEILGSIKINRIEDKEAKFALFKNLIAMRKVAKESAADSDEIIRKFQEDWEDEIPAIRKFREADKPVLGHLDYLEAEKDANKAISDIFSQEVELDIDRIPEGPLCDPNCWDANITAGDILGAIDYLKDNGIIGE